MNLCWTLLEMPWRSIQSLLLYMVQTVYPNLRDFCLTSSQVRVPYAALSRTKLSDAVQSIYSLDRRNINILDYKSITACILQWRRVYYTY